MEELAFSLQYVDYSEIVIFFSPITLSLSWFQLIQVSVYYKHINYVMFVIWSYISTPTPHPHPLQCATGKPFATSMLVHFGETY